MLNKGLLFLVLSFSFVLSGCSLVKQIGTKTNISENEIDSCNFKVNGPVDKLDGPYKKYQGKIYYNLECGVEVENADISTFKRFFSKKSPDFFNDFAKDKNTVYGDRSPLFSGNFDYKTLVGLDKLYSMEIESGFELTWHGAFKDKDAIYFLTECGEKGCIYKRRAIVAIPIDKFGNKKTGGYFTENKKNYYFIFTDKAINNH